MKLPQILFALLFSCSVTLAAIQPRAFSGDVVLVYAATGEAKVDIGGAGDRALTQGHLMRVEGADASLRVEVDATPEAAAIVISIAEVDSGDE